MPPLQHVWSHSVAMFYETHVPTLPTTCLCRYLASILSTTWVREDIMRIPWRYWRSKWRNGTAPLFTQHAPRFPLSINRQIIMAYCSYREVHAEAVKNADKTFLLHCITKFKLNIPMQNCPVLTVQFRECHISIPEFGWVFRSDIGKMQLDSESVHETLGWPKQMTSCIWPADWSIGKGHII